MNRRCRRCWLAWLLSSGAVFAYLEARGWSHGCHPTLSRELRRWVRSDRCKWAPLVFAIGGAALSWHLMNLKELPVLTGRNK